VLNPFDHPILVFVFSLSGLWISARFGAAFKKRQRDRENDVNDDFDILFGATLTLLALIIGFTFSMAVTRYDQRKNLEEQEANAIGTEYVRAANELSRSAHTLLQVHRWGTTSADQRANRSAAGQDVVRGRDAYCCAAYDRGGTRRHWHERCVELAGIHPGRLVEPNPSCGMDSLDGDLRLLQHLDRLSSTWKKSLPVSNFAYRPVYLAFSDIGHR
jgi:hypothetical protein